MKNSFEKLSDSKFVVSEEYQRALLGGFADCPKTNKSVKYASSGCPTGETCEDVRCDVVDDCPIV